MNLAILHVGVDREVQVNVDSIAWFRTDEYAEPFKTILVFASDAVLYVTETVDEVRAKVAGAVRL